MENLLGFFTSLDVPSGAACPSTSSNVDLSHVGLFLIFGTMTGYARS